MTRNDDCQLTRVTIVMPSASPTGGAEEAFWQLLNSTAARSIDWQVVFLEQGPLVERVAPLVKQAIVVPCDRTRKIWSWWRASGQILQHAQNFEAQLVLGWMSKGHVYGGLAAWRGAIPAAWFQMGLPGSGYIDRASRWLPTRVVLACSDFVAREQRAKQPSTRIASVPLGVDLSRFDLQKLPTPAEARRQLGLPLDVPIIGIVGRLQHWKGMHVLLDAMPAILRQQPAARCLIVGGPYPAEPDYELKLRKQAFELGIADQVTFAGSQANVPLWMQAMDVFVHASQREPFGIVVIEALALGKPVLATVPGGPEQIIEHGVNGWLCRYGQPDDIAQFATKALTDFLPRHADLARKSALRFSQDNYANHVTELLRENATNKTGNASNANADFEPIFVVGAPRSGTTLLTVMLGRHSSVIASPETKIFRDLPLDWRKREYQSHEELANSFRSWTHLVDLKIDVEELLHRFRSVAPTYPNYIRTVLECFAARHGKPRIVEKTPEHMFDIPLILELYPNAKVIWLLRDGRDNVLAIARHFKHGIRRCSFYWRAFALLGEKWEARFQDRVMRLRFEDLVMNPAGSMSAVCSFLNLDYQPEMLDNRVETVAIPRHERKHKQQATDTIDPLRVGQYKRIASPKQLRVMQSVIGPEMVRLGMMSDKAGAQTWLSTLANSALNLPWYLLYHPSITLLTTRFAWRRRIGRMLDALTGNVSHLYGRNPEEVAMILEEEELRYRPPFVSQPKESNGTSELKPIDRKREQGE